MGLLPQPPQRVNRKVEQGRAKAQEVRGKAHRRLAKRSYDRGIRLQRRAQAHKVRAIDHHMKAKS